MAFPNNLASDPVVCSNIRLYFMIVGQTSKPGNAADKTYSVAYNFTSVDIESPWTQFGTKQFSSSPACVFEQPYRYIGQPTDHHFVLAGKGTDNKMYALPGHQAEGMNGNPPPNPQWDSAWAEAKQSTETSPTFSGNYGRPALATSGSLVVLTFLNSDASGLKIRARTRATPYASNSWSAIKNGPTLPSGVTADGVPAIVYDRGPSSAPFNKFVIMVRGIASGTAGLYWTTFDGTNWGTWTQAFTSPYSIDSDPSLEYDDQTDAITMYYKSGGAILQNSAQGPGGFGVYETASIDTTGPTAPISISAPRVVWGAGGDSPPYGIRTVISRGYNADTTGAQNSTILWNADHHYDPFPPFGPNLPEDGAAACSADVVTREVFGNHAAGCAGTSTWTASTGLCGSGSRPCTAAEWVAARGSAIPAHNYWTSDNLRYTGSPISCSVSTTSGSLCTSGQPMRICVASGADPEGNLCNWHGCGLNTVSPNQYFGGCEGSGGNLTAGTLCCLAVP
jgi:hypothetical protein